MTERERDDNRYGEDLTVSFAIYCDTHGLTVEEGGRLAEQIGAALEICAADRAFYGRET